VEVICAKYVKNGKIVFLTFDLIVSKILSGNNSVYVMLEGLPFKAVTCDGLAGSVVVSYFQEMNTPTTFISGSVISDSYACHLWHEKANVTELPKLERSQLKVKSRLQGTVTYISSE
jgi:hypothetical protein